MAIEKTATVISLHSHPASAAAQRRAHARAEAMRRHPSYLSKLGSTALARELSAVVIPLDGHRGHHIAG